MAEFKDIFIEGTSRSPQIDFNHHTGELILFGKSTPENAAKVYDPLLKWTTEYIKSPHLITNLRLNLEYFNSSTLIWLVKLVKELSKIKNEDCVLYVHFYFDLEDYDEMDSEELKNIISSLVDNIGEIKISVGIKAYGTDENGKIVRESTILI